jgi:hypothetical protein
MELEGGCLWGLSLLEKAFSNGCLVGWGCYITTVTKGCYSCIIVIPFRLPIAEGGQDGVVGLWSGTTLAGWGIISGGLNFMMDIFDFSLHKFYLCLLELCSDSGTGSGNAELQD